MPTNPVETAALFRRFAERECDGVSPFYASLTRKIAESPYLLQLAHHHAKARQPIPNLFLGAVHYLLLKNPHVELAQSYPSIRPDDPAPFSMELFLAFCKAHEPEMIHLLSTRMVQTNVVNRTAYLMPLLSQLDGPCALIDLGASSGLNLFQEQFQYDYGEGGTFGEGDVNIQSNIRGSAFPAVRRLPTIIEKIAIEQNPLNVQDPDHARWLQALIWPDLSARFDRIKAAIEVAKTGDISWHQANNTTDFKGILDSISSELAIFLYHTHVLYQFTAAERRVFREMLDEVGQKRNLDYVAAEANPVFDDPSFPAKGVSVQLTRYRDGKKVQLRVAATDGHATWIEWDEGALRALGMLS